MLSIRLSDSVDFPLNLREGDWEDETDPKLAVLALPIRECVIEEVELEARS